MKLSVDTNILIYSVDPNDKVKQATASDILLRMARDRHPLVENSLFEFLNATTRKLGVPLGLASASVSAWIGSFDIALSPRGTIAAAIQLLTQYKLSVWDARILAICDANGVGVLLTEDLQDGAKYGKVTAINPFEPANAVLLSTLLPP